MTKKEYLKQVRQMDKKIDIMLSELAALKTMATKVTSVISSMPGSATRNTGKMENAVLKIIEQEAAIDKAVDDYVDKRREIIAALDEMKDSECADLLRLRYLDGKTWGEVAQALHTSTRRIYNIHAKALNDFKMPS